MHYYLIEIKKVIDDDIGSKLRCWETDPDDNNSTLTIEDNRYSDGAQYIAEWSPSYYVHLGFRVTPSLQDVGGNEVADIYEMFHELAGKNSLLFFPTNKTQKIYVIATPLQISGRKYTQIKATLDDALARLMNFRLKHMDETHERLIKHKIKPI